MQIERDPNTGTASTPSATPAPAPPVAPFDPQPVVDRGITLARRMYARLDPAGDDGLGRARVKVHGGSNSFFNRITRTVNIGAGEAVTKGETGRLELLETTVHELTHKWMDTRAGFGGLVYAGAPGRLSEGLSQVMAGAALVLEGDAAEQAHGWFLLDPRGKTAPMRSEFGRPTKYVPLSVTMDDVRASGFTMSDNGYVHVHSGVIQAAHLDIARALGMEEMARITTDAARTSLTQLTGFRAWADATLEAAERRHGAGSAQQRAVLDAWRAAKVLTDA
ncbi:MAG: peptidase thermolysin [Thermoleophilia bacterium]|nr:peptidase thermolysin [Thermoleophilia bacterium]